MRDWSEDSGVVISTKVDTEEKVIHLTGKSSDYYIEDNIIIGNDIEYPILGVDKVILDDGVFNISEFNTPPELHDVSYLANNDGEMVFDLGLTSNIDGANFHIIDSNGDYNITIDNDNKKFILNPNDFSKLSPEDNITVEFTYVVEDKNGLLSNEAKAIVSIDGSDSSYINNYESQNSDIPDYMREMKYDYNNASSIMDVNIYDNDDEYSELFITDEKSESIYDIKTSLLTTENKSNNEMKTTTTELNNFDETININVNNNDEGFPT